MRSRRKRVRLVAIATSAVIVGVGLVLVGAPPATTMSAANAPRSEATSRPDSVSAMLAARTTDQRVEDLSARTPTSATYANPSGTWTTEAFTGVVRSKIDDNDWVEVDGSLEKGPTAYEPKAVPFGVQFSDGGERTVGSATLPGGGEIDVDWSQKLPKPVVSGSELTYPDVVADGDLIVNSEPTGFNYSILLNKAPSEGAAQLEYRFPLQFRGLKATVRSDGSVTLKDGGRRVAELTAPVMWESSAQHDALVDGATGTKRAVGATIEGEGAERTLVLRPDMSFLTDPNTSYPVTIDPSLVINAGGDTWVQNVGDTSSQQASPELRVGSNDGGVSVARSYLQFDMSAFTALPAATVQLATLSLSNFEAGSCTGNDIRVSRITSGWTVPSVTWATQPTVTSSNSAVTSGAFGAPGCPSEDSMVFNMTSMVNDWLGGTWNPGIQIKADNETAAAGFRRARSLENGTLGKAPKLTITYNSYPSRAVGVNAVPGATYGSTNYVTSLTPTLSTTVSDPDGGAVRGYFEVRDSADSTTLWSGSSGWATSGAMVSAAVPTGVLTNGSTFKIRAYSQDATLKSQTPIYRTIVIDTSAPATVITATNYVNNTWSATMPASNTFKFDGPTDTAYFDAELDGVRSTIGANASGDFSFPYTYVAEWHVFRVVAVDKAGNRGATASFSFGSAAPGFTLPRQNAVSTSAFPLDISAQPTSSGVAIQWRLQGETAWRSAGQVTKAGSAYSGAVSTSGGRSTTGALVWKAANEAYGSGTLKAPAIVNLRACFHYTSAADKCTYNRTLQLVPSAFGENFPTADLGPAKVALFTGEVNISGSDAADAKAKISRTFSSFDSSTLSNGLFGPGWTDPGILGASGDAQASIVDNRLKDKSIVVVDGDGGAQTFVPVGTSVTNFVPLLPTGDKTSLTFTAAAGANPAKLELKRPLGVAVVATTWTLKTPDGGGADEWTADSVDAPGTDADVTVVSQFERPVFVRESDPSAAATCNATTQTEGCRGLKFAYSGSGSSARVSSISRVVGAAIPANVVVKTIATYSYDGTGKLSAVCTPVPSAGKPALCVSYAYTTVAGRTLLSEVQPPGLKKWRFAYDATGRLLTVKREKPAGGDSTWSVDYALVPGGAGQPTVTAAALAEWGQTTVPTRVFAVYSPRAGTQDINDADLYYTSDDGTLLNTATRSGTSWLMDARWYDLKGNPVQELDANGFARVQAASAADRPRVAAEASSYITYATWGNADVDGTRVTDTYGPAHTATLKNGTTGLFRAHVKTVYDDSPGVDPSLISDRTGTEGLGLVVKTVNSASDAAKSTDYDSLATEYRYGRVVASDGDGWTLGKPTKVRTQIDATAWSESVSRYDASGRVIESRNPGGSEDSSHAGNDALSTVTSYYTASGSGDCGNKPAWDGLVCKVGPAAQPSGPSMPTTFTSSYNDDLMPTTIEKISDLTTPRSSRTSTKTYDSIGRNTGVTISTSGPNVANETLTTIYGYDDSTGLPTTNTSGGDVVTVGYDTWGRQNSYADSLGTTSSSTFNEAGNLATMNDGTATYTYTYNADEVLTGVDGGAGAGTFNYAYNSAGQVSAVTYPNGMSATRTYDESGASVGLTYMQGSTQMLAFASSSSADGTKVARSSNASTQEFSFDGLGRLKQVLDTRSAGCTTRTYGFDASSNRSSSAEYAPAAGGGCQTATVSKSASNTYDASSRIRNSGYSYDTLGRALTVPAADLGVASAGPVALSYHANDKVASMTQDVLAAGGGTNSVTRTYGLDPADRINTIKTSVNGAESERLRYRFGADGDVPTRIDSSSDAGSSWTQTRYVSVPEVGLAEAISGGTTTLQLVNMDGDIVATMPATAGGSTINSYGETDEFGRTADDNQIRYRWLGARYRSTDTLGGLVLMGARLYNPGTGMFTSKDVVDGGNLTAYTYSVDPINTSDVGGKATCHKYKNSDCPTGWITYHTISVPIYWHKEPDIFGEMYMTRGEEEFMDFVVSYNWPYARTLYWMIGLEVNNLYQRNWKEIGISANYRAHYRIKVRTTVHVHVRLKVRFIGFKFWATMVPVNHSHILANFGTTKPPTYG